MAQASSSRERFGGDTDGFRQQLAQHVFSDVEGRLCVLFEFFPKQRPLLGLVLNSCLVRKWNAVIGKLLWNEWGRIVEDRLLVGVVFLVCVRLLLVNGVGNGGLLCGAAYRAWVPPRGSTKVSVRNASWSGLPGVSFFRPRPDGGLPMPRATRGNFVLDFNGLGCSELG